MASNDILEYVREQLKARRGEWQSIASASGVPYFTLSKIASGTTKNPRWKTLQSLAQHFENEPDAA